VTRKPYSIYRRRDWAPKAFALTGLTLAAVALAIVSLYMAGVRFR
jgi:hypothetical protein